MSKLKEWLLVLIAMSASTWLQLLSLAKWNVWHDESFTAMMINYGWRQIVVRTAHSFSTK